MWRSSGELLLDNSNSQSFPKLATKGADFDPAIAALGQKYWWITDRIKIFYKYFCHNVAMKRGIIIRQFQFPVIPNIGNQRRRLWPRNCRIWAKILIEAKLFYK